MQRVEVVEVGPRDGLQNEDVILGIAERVELIERLVRAGLRRVEVASFVNPRLVPQMADAEAVVAALPDRADVSYIGLVLNERGLERALTTKVDEINFALAATDAFNGRNQNARVAETMTQIESMIPQAHEAGRRVSVTIGVAFGCPYEGEVELRQVVALAERARAAGADEIVLADTIGVADPAAVRTAIDAVRRACPGVQMRCHFHNTRNTGVANAYAAFEEGVAALDSSVGGTGGCPFAPQATGNVATEDLVYMFDRMDVGTGADVRGLIATAAWLSEKLGKPPASMVAKAGAFP